MSKSTVDEIVDSVKVLVDYNIDDDDLTTLIIKGINFALKRMKQFFLNEGIYRQISGTAELTTTEDQEYIDISSTPVDFDQHIQLTERTNDSPISLIPFKEYRKLYPDPSADKSLTPDVAAIFDNKLYLGPTPSEEITIYLDYIKLITKVTSTDTLSFDDKYDELVVAIGIEYLVKFLDRNSVTALTSAKLDVKEAYDTLIGKAVKNIGLRQGSQSRRGDIPYFSPKKVI
jgi:hypothetical protein